MAKAILLVRVSTTRQEIDTQKKDLIEYAMADGYKKNELIIIEGVGASAIKLNKLYLAEIENLYQTIQNDTSINAVYAWEISRIGRNEEKLMQIKNFLISHKIQLVIKNPSLRLLNNDGSVNNGVELAFSLFATMSKQEMEIKKDRFARAKARNKAEGKYNGGKIKIGYKLDANKYFIVDEEKAQIVRQCFEWYLGDMGLKKIYDKLVDFGIFSSLKYFNDGGKRVSVLLKDKAYTGEGIYPQIVDIEVFNKAQEKLSILQKWHNSKNIYFCKGLIKDTTTGATFIARCSTLVYYLRHREHCISLNLNVMDFIAEYSANVLLAHYNAQQAQTNKNEYKLKIEENNNIISSKQAQKKEYQKAIERAIEMNIRQPKYFPTEKMEAVIKQNETHINKLNTEITDLETEITRMKNWLNGQQQFINTIKGVSDAKKQEMINQVIEKIEVTKVEKRHFKIVIKNKIGVICNSWFEYKSKGHYINIEQVYEDGRRFDLTQQINENKRFQRKRYNNK